MNRNDILTHWFEKGEFDQHHDAFINSITDESGFFNFQESTYFDYKDQFPFSLSDDYAYGIFRLICALHNTFGGLIIFGVHDTKRSSGHNKVEINIERLNTALRDTLTHSIECVHHKYNQSGVEIDLLFVPKRGASLSPVRLARDIGKYPAGSLWFRRGHEVLKASSDDTVFLFGPRRNLYEDDIKTKNVYSSLPSNPSTIKRFVGRVSVLCRLFDWFVDDDEPRKFLWGRGGSGKSTIAFEFAKLIKEHSADIVGYDNNSVDFIIFLSAKEIFLDPIKASSAPFIGNDFSSFRELLESIVTLGPSSESDLSNWSVEELKKEVSVFLKSQTVFLVIDDIDTLTTKGEDGGLDFFYKSVVRSDTGSRVLYTQRNAPTASLVNAIEVPGLDAETEYPEFVRLCCEQFRQPTPSNDFLTGPLLKQSEGIPLIIETIVGLRRSTGSYERAIEKFNSMDGASAREYLFKREYDRLDRDNRARNLLASLACFKKGASARDLQTVLRYDLAQVEDAISETYEMFLTIENTEKDETQYSLNDVTKSFILEQSKNLQFFPNIKEKVAALSRGAHPHIREIARIEFEVLRLLNKYLASDALDLLNKETDPKITEHPKYKMLRGFCFARLSTPRYADAREDFRYCVNVGYDDANMMREWANMERDSGIGAAYLSEICDAVIENHRYSPRVRAEFTARKGSNIFYMALGEAQVNPTDAFEKIAEALEWNCRALVEYQTIPNANSDKSFYICRNTGMKLVEVSYALSYDKITFDRFEQIGVLYKEFRYDCLVEPLISFLNTLPRAQDISFLNRRAAVLNDIFKKAKAQSAFKFSSSDARDAFLNALTKNLGSIQNNLRILRGA